MELPQAGFMGAVIVVNALIELVKRVDTGDRARKFYPILAEVLGFGLGLGVGLNWFEALFVGLSAMGLYSGVRHTANTLRNNG